MRHCESCKEYEESGGLAYCNTKYELLFLYTDCDQYHKVRPWGGVKDFSWEHLVKREDINDEEA